MKSSMVRCHRASASASRPSRSPHARRGASRNGRGGGFTLIELLVVVAIIGLLVGILLPSLSRAKENARRSVCMAHLSQISLATQMYISENRDVTPAGHYNNASGISPRGTGRGVGAGLSNGLQVWDSIGGLLEAYLQADPRDIYRCPSARTDTEDDNFQISGDDPFSGTAPDDVFKPNYFYMCTAQWIVTPASTFWYPQVWATRNVANLPLSRIRMPAETVAWVDESTSHHTNSPDIYNRNAAGNLNVEDVDHFAYLDGHVSRRSFRNLCGYFQRLHGPIPQRQWGLTFEQQPHWTISNDFPPGCQP